MDEPLIPPEDLEPENEQSPFEDPLLDAFERSIENPHGFVDPMTEHDQAIDELAGQLEAVENSIEGTQPPVPEPVMESEMDDPLLQDSELAEPESSVDDEDPTDGTDEEKEQLPEDPAPNKSDDNVLRGGSFLDPLLQKPRAGEGRTGPGIRPPVRKSPGRATGAGRLSKRLCPETHELIDEQKCQSCDKYRHWPDGTDEEPRECWYDWQARASDDEQDSQEG